MTTAQAQQMASMAINAARFDGGNYFFAYTDAGVTLALPDKSFIGVNRYNVVDPYGDAVQADDQCGDCRSSDFSQIL